MKKRYIIISILILLSILMIWGNQMISYCALKYLDTDIVKLGYFVDNHLSANISIVKDEREYNVTINNIKPKCFFLNGGVSISQINDFTLISKGCNTSIGSPIIDTKTNQNVGYRYYTNRLNFENNDILNSYFSVDIKNIKDFIERIDIVENKLMKISTQDYLYYTDKNENEIYMRRVNLNSDSFRTGLEIIKTDTTCLFKNSDCCGK